MQCSFRYLYSYIVFNLRGKGKGMGFEEMKDGLSGMGFWWFSLIVIGNLWICGVGLDNIGLYDMVYYYIYS